jgi:hypothetical protein
MLIDGKQLKLKIEHQLKTSKRCILCSAFFSEIASKWLVEHRASGNETQLLVRGLPFDFLDGANSFTALEKAIKSGIKVKLSSALHAKVYVFDDVLFASSSNLTGKGIALLEHHNIEFGLKSRIEPDDIELIHNLWRQGVSVDLELLEKMQDHIENFTDEDQSNMSFSLVWPSEWFEEQRDLYISDFPIDPIDDDRRWSNLNSFIKTKAFAWIHASVQEKEWKSFGELSHELHNAVYDDPAPYRKEIKAILANLLALIAKFDTDLVVERPRHRQIVKLKS